MKKETQQSGKKIVTVENKMGKIIRRRVLEMNYMPSMTEQQFKDDVDANTIVKKYGYNQLPQPTGLYMDASEVPDLSIALETVSKAQNAFDTLPSELRERFGNSPELMLKFLSNPKNKQEALDLGLLNKPIPEPSPIKVSITNPPDKVSITNPPEQKT